MFENKFRFIKIFILISAINISAQQDDTVRTYILEETVITGTRFEQEKSILPLNITVINKSEVENSLDHNVLPLINNSVPGLFLNERNMLGYGVGPVSSGEISIRGIGESPNTGVLVLVDGQPQFMGIFGHPINDSYLRDNVVRIEVIRGPASLLYGSNAFGGAVNIITKNEELRNGLSLNGSISYGSFNTSVFSGSVGYKLEKFNFMAAASHSQTSGHRKDGDDDFKSNFASLKISYMLSDNFTLSADADINDSKFYDPGPETAPVKNQFYDYLRGRTAFSLENSFRSFKGGLKFFYNYGDHNFYDGWKSTDNLLGLSFYQNLEMDNTILTAGFDYKNLGGKGKNENIPPVAAVGLNKILSIDETEGYAVVQSVFFNFLNLSAGVRATKNSVYGSEYTPQFGFSASVDNATVIKGNAGKAFRSPTAADLYLFPVSNEELEPERLWTYEIGISKFLFDYQLQSELTFFYIDAENIIQLVPAGMGFRKLNSGSFNNKGIELMLAVSPLHSFNAALNYSYLHTSIKLPYAPEQKLNLHLEFNHNIFTITSNLQGIVNLYPEGGIEQIDYITLSLSLMIRLSGEVSFFIKGNNITDQKYYIDQGFPSPGINFLSGIRAAL